MATRTYRCTLAATITTDEDTVKSAMLGFRLSDDETGEVIDDLDETFDMQQQLLDAPADRIMGIFLTNGYFKHSVREAIRQKLERDLPGAQVTLGGIDVFSD